MNSFKAVINLIIAVILKVNEIILVNLVESINFNNYMQITYSFLN